MHNLRYIILFWPLFDSNFRRLLSNSSPCLKVRNIIHMIFKGKKNESFFFFIENGILIIFFIHFNLSF